MNKWIKIDSYPLALKFCSVCNLFHPYFQFYDLTTDQFQPDCTPSLVNKAIIEGILSCFPRVVNPTPPSKEESKAVLSKKALNRCRSPSAIFLNRKNVKGKCMHCRRYLLQEYQRKETDTEPWVCSFCQEHWFENNETKCYHFCKVCKAFHFAV